jgi:putative glutamine amidotransferase
MTAPLIGITTYGINEREQYHLYANYLVAVRKAGGVPVMLAPGENHVDVMCDRLDGIIFTGGGDFNPETVKGEFHPTIYNLDDERDSFDLALARKALASPLPILGICRGMQTLHLASGGKPLVSHVPDYFDGSILHRQEPPSVNVRAKPTNHEVQVMAGSLLSAIMDSETMPVVSWHHQAVPTLAEGWVLCGQAADGLIEAIAHQHHPWALAVQWHPEMSIDDGYQIRIFNAFVAACHR